MNVDQAVVRRKNLRLALSLFVVAIVIFAMTFYRLVHGSHA